MKIEVGMYARTDLGVIAKITKVLEFKYRNYYLNYHNVAINCPEKNVLGNKGMILKASYDITDLIKPGDIIKNNILGVRDILNINTERKEIGLSGMMWCISFEEFKESFENGTLFLVTKELFESVIYTR